MSSPIPIGSIRLYDQIAPLLTAATYRVTTSAEVANANTGDKTAFPPAPADATFLQVGGPRFALGPEEVATVHPPATAKGAFGLRLPHIALTRRTLPWERTPVVAGGGWLALLVAQRHTDTQAGEVVLQSGQLQPMVGSQIYSMIQAVQSADPRLPVTVARFTSNRVLRAILPQAAELALLTHVRQVNVADTALDVGDDDGWFAVVTANRLPLDTSSGAGTDYVAMLVSLEGRTDLYALPDDDQPAPPVIVLTSWNFTSAGTGSFEQLAGQLDVGLFGTAAPAAGNGTITVTHTDRDGVSGPATYRSPLVAQSWSVEQPLPGTGDLTAGAAFELGRLLGAADGRFTREIVGWHRDLDNAARAAISASTLSNALAAAPGRPGGQSVLPAINHDAPPGAAIGAALLHRLAGAHPSINPVGAHPAALAAATAQQRSVETGTVGTRPDAGKRSAAKRRAATDERSTAENSGTALAELATLRRALVAGQPAAGQPAAGQRPAGTPEQQPPAKQAPAKQTAKQAGAKQTAKKAGAKQAPTKKTATKNFAAKKTSAEQAAKRAPRKAT
ncbi:MAG TPA: hypothetical protein VFU36_18315 [Jatrophihabitans sp.]|nr:hypothetical protein [Jatrophihabitans sp.]